MLEMFSYTFIQRAFMVGAILAVILPCVGLPLILKRLSPLGDTLSHASLAGVSLGIFLGINPIIGAIVFSVLASLGVEVIRKKLKEYQEVATVIILGASIGFAGVLTSISKNATSLSSYLFGSIVTISDFEFYLIIFIALIVLMVFRFIYDSLFLRIFNPTAAKLLKVNIRLIDFLTSFLSAIVISVSAKTIGTLIVSSLLIIPPITAMQYKKTYKGTLFLSMFLSLIYIYFGLIISFYLNLKPGSVIVLISVLVLIITLLVREKNKLSI